MFFGVYFYLVIVVFLSAQDFLISCPASGFTVGVSATITCKANKAAFASECLGNPTLVKFHFKPSGGVRSEWCSSDYTSCPNTGTPDSACGTCGCGCETDDGTFLTHRLSFTPTAAQDGGEFTCEVVCGHILPLPSLTNDNCDAVSVGELIMWPSLMTM